MDTPTTTAAAAAPVNTDKKVLTLLMVVRDGSVLLGEKKRGFGEGFYNGFGGKVEEGETVEEATLRELEEEAGIKATDASKRLGLPPARSCSFARSSDVLTASLWWYRLGLYTVRHWW